MRFLGLFFMVWLGSSAFAFQGSDLVGSSAVCKPLNNQGSAWNCELSSVMSKLPFLNISQVGSTLQEQNFAAKVKNQLFQQAKEAFTENVATANWALGQSLYQHASPLRQKTFQKSLTSAEKSCAPKFGNNFKDVVLDAGQKTLKLSDDPKEDAHFREKFSQRYLLAFLAVSQLKLGLDDNYFHGEEKLKAQKRLQQIIASYPMTTNSYTLSLQQTLQKHYPFVIFNKKFSEDSWLDDYLIPDPQTKKFKLEIPPAKSKTALGQIADKLNLEQSMPMDLKTELQDLMQLSVEKSVKSFQELCEADACTAFGVSQGQTASLLSSEKENSKALLASVCQCNLREDSHLMPAAPKYSLIAAGLGGCFIFPISCPAATALVAVETLGENAVNVLTVSRASDIKRISDFLPGLATQDRKAASDFQSSATTRMVTTAAVSAASYPIGNAAEDILHKGVAIVGKKIANQRAKIQDLEVFKAEMRTFPATSHLTEKERTEIAKRMQTHEEAPVETVLQLENSKVVQYMNRDFQQWLKIETPAEKSLMGGSKKRDLFVDSKTKALDANDEAGRQLVKEMVEKSSDPVSVIFLDVNNLGKVNYFHPGQSAGDDYLSAVGTAIRENLRKEDLIFKTGGDELVFIIKSKDPEIIKRIQEKIVDAVHNSPETARVFKEEAIQIKKLQKEILEANSFSDLPKDYANKLSKEETDKAIQNFASFQKAKVTEMEQAYRNHDVLHPSISIGAKIVGKDETYEAAKIAAEGQAKQVKIEYKQAAGEDIFKYTGTRSDTRRLQPGIKPKPKVLDPIGP